DAAKSLDIESFRHLTITATSSINSSPSQLAIPLRLEGTLEQYLQRHPIRMRLNIDDLGAWQKNIAPRGQMSFTSPAAGQWRTELSFKKKGDKWPYPKFALPKLPAGTVRGVLLRARAAENASVRLMVFKNQAAIYWTSEPIIPADGNWHAAWIPVE